MSTIEFEILEILIKCEFPSSSYRNFANVTRLQLRRLSMEELESRLTSYLPPSPERPSLVAKFMAGLFNLQSSQNPEQPIIPIPMTLKVKQEAIDNNFLQTPEAFVNEMENNLLQELMERQDEQENSHAAAEAILEQHPLGVDDQEQERVNPAAVIPLEEPDLDVTIVDEVINVSVIGVLNAETKAKKRILDDVTIEDDVDEIDSTINPPGREESSTVSKKRKAEIAGPSAALVSTADCQNSSKVKKSVGSVFQLGWSAAQCNTGGRKAEWTKKEFRDLVSPSTSHLVGTLRIVSNCYKDYNSLSFKEFSLPNLATLELHHRVTGGGDASLSGHDVNYCTQLSLILDGSPALNQIEISFENEMALKTLLRVLGSVQSLPSLSSLSIRHRDEEEMAALLASELTALGNITAPNLRKLHLACCIWVDGDGTEVKIAFQNMLQRFPKLTNLKIDGCFVTTLSDTDIWPKIVLDFPTLVHLQALKLGANCKYLSTLETTEELPKKKKRKMLEINLEPDQREGIRIFRTDRVHVIDDETSEYFPVSVNFPGTMPRLKSISFGVLYEFQSFYFPEFPALKVFRVASQWAQSYPDCFPPATGKKSSRDGLMRRSKVEELQIPDSFKDCSMIGKILSHFPNLTRIHINLPKVKFLRAFAKTMATTGPASFQHLEMRTQFDFASSLDSCVLDKIVKPSAREIEKIKILKDYEHWEEYVAEYEIELPQEIVEQEDSEKFCGLSVLFTKLKSVSIRHIPRILRLPKGTNHFIMDPKPEFSNTLIGFKEYPFSKAVKSKCPPTLKITCHDFDMSQVSSEFLVTDYYESRLVTLDPAAPSVKHEVKREELQ